MSDSIPLVVGCIQQLPDTIEVSNDFMAIGKNKHQKGAQHTNTLPKRELGCDYLSKLVSSVQADDRSDNSSECGIYETVDDYDLSDFCKHTVA